MQTRAYTATVNCGGVEMEFNLAKQDKSERWSDILDKVEKNMLAHGESRDGVDIYSFDCEFCIRGIMS
jgi:hypothetical protein